MMDNPGGGGWGAASVQMGGFGKNPPKAVRASVASSGSQFEDDQKRHSVAHAHAERPIRYKRDSTLEQWEKSTGLRHKIGNLIFSQQFEMFIGIVVLLNFVTITYETDGRCTMNENSEHSDVYKRTETAMEIIGNINVVFLVIYVMECSSRLFVQHLDFFKNGWNMFDLSIVLCGIVGEIFERILTESESSAESMGVLRTMRMIRLLRVSRILISFQELYALISGLVNCMKTLTWAAGLVFLSLTIWSIIAVEYMHPLMDALERDGEYQYCSWCPTAFKGIMNANLTFFQIISGDGWSSLARGLIERHPWTAIVFVGIIFTMVFGLLNLVTAVIVDTAVRARELDVESMCLAQELQRNDLWKKFRNMCQDMDKDDSGCISLNELQTGFKEVPELRQFLSVMGVQEEDLVKIFSLLDIDKSGTLSFDEFSGELQKLKTNHTQYTTYYIKRLTEDSHRIIQDFCEQHAAPSANSKTAGKSDRNSTRSTASTTSYEKLSGPPAIAVKQVTPTLEQNYVKSLEPQSEESLGLHLVPLLKEKEVWTQTLLDAMSKNDWRVMASLEDMKEKIDALREKLDELWQKIKHPSPALMVNNIMPNGHISEGPIPYEGQLRENNNARLTSNRCGSLCHK